MLRRNDQGVRMADETDAVGALEGFWRKAGVTVICPVCRNDALSIDKGAEIHVPMARGLSPQPPPAWLSAQEAYMVYCGKCGFLMPFMRRIIDSGAAAPIQKSDTESEQG
jgi:uncharacterized protein YbaR (Trm112 family)